LFLYFSVVVIFYGLRLDNGIKMAWNCTGWYLTQVGEAGCWGRTRYNPGSCAIINILSRAWPVPSPAKAVTPASSSAPRSTTVPTRTCTRCHCCQRYYKKDCQQNGQHLFHSTRDMFQHLFHSFFIKFYTILIRLKLAQLNWKNTLLTKLWLSFQISFILYSFIDTRTFVCDSQFNYASSGPLLIIIIIYKSFYINSYIFFKSGIRIFINCAL
jgi:hypothetical protein